MKLRLTFSTGATESIDVSVRQAEYAKDKFIRGENFAISTLDTSDKFAGDVSRVLRLNSAHIVCMEALDDLV